MDLLRLQAAPLSVAEVLDHVAHPRAGGACLFAGTVRDHSDGVEGVTHLEYEAYEEAAEGAMARVADAVRAAVPEVIGIAILHRYGSLPVGEASVVVAASAPHRDQAFAAARLAIDLVKQIVPIWKKEHRSDGSSAWVACHDEGQHAGAAARGPAAPTGPSS